MDCPAPVVSTKRALEEVDGIPLLVLLDDGAPRENVARFARNRGFQVTEEPRDGSYALLIGADGKKPSPGAFHEGARGEKVLLITRDTLGDGSDDLGRLLMKNFIITLLDLETVPDRMIFLNGGVHLTTEGSEVLEVLEKLGNSGTEILSCGICLDFFGKKDKLRAGSATNMFTTVESVLNAGLAIKL
jgi:selenium metabolism protein YedF